MNIVTAMNVDVVRIVMALDVPALQHAPDSNMLVLVSSCISLDSNHSPAFTFVSILYVHREYLWLVLLLLLRFPLYIAIYN